MGLQQPSSFPQISLGDAACLSSKFWDRQALQIASPFTAGVNRSGCELRQIPYEKFMISRDSVPDDIDFFEAHDAFTIMAALSLEGRWVSAKKDRDLAWQ
jgi:hypothetical protein